MARPKLLDLFCGAGGAAMGYHRAGFDVTGVDIVPQPRYPFRFVQDDALEYAERWGRSMFDAVHASPPCQRFTRLRSMWRDREHEDQVGQTREVLVYAGRPFVIENVPHAPLRPDVVLCGTMFGLGLPERRAYLRRHRWFEFGPDAPGMILVPPCSHPPGWRPIAVYGHAGGSSTRTGLPGWKAAERRRAMGVDWMTVQELSESIPPAYTEFVGACLMEVL